MTYDEACQLFDIAATARQRRKWEAGEGLAYKLAQAFRAQIAERREENAAREKRNTERRDLNRVIAETNDAIAEANETDLANGVDPKDLTPLIEPHKYEGALPLVTREEMHSWLRADSRARREESERRQTEADREGQRKMMAHIKRGAR